MKEENVPEETKDTQQTEAPQQGGQAKSGSGGGASPGKVALGVAALAAATGAGAAALAKQRSGSGSSSGRGSENGKRSDGGGRGEPIVSAVVGASRSAMFDALLPAAEQAAEAAGRFLATSGPDFLRERIVPKFVAAFEENADKQ
jgi:hypothetical protein